MISVQSKKRSQIRMAEEQLKGIPTVEE